MMLIIDDKIIDLTEFNRRGGIVLATENETGNAHLIKEQVFDDKELVVREYTQLPKNRA